MTILIDSREHKNVIQGIIKAFDDRGIIHRSTKLFVGDYMNFDNPRLVVDRKHNLSEVASNFTDVRKDKKGRSYSRFENEMQTAHEFGIKVIFLIEHSNRIKSIEDVASWNNPRLKVSPLAISGERMARKMLAFQNWYNVEFQFCDKAHTGERIVEILGGA